MAAAKPATAKKAKSAPAKKATRSVSKSTGEFTCPECGKTFGRAAALGAHRNRAHGVAGVTARARGTSRRRNQRSAAAGRIVRAASGRRSANGRRIGVDRDALLRSLFPNGVPAREAVIRETNLWLDQAERLARMK